MENIFKVFGHDGYAYAIKAKSKEEAQKIIDDRLTKSAKEKEIKTEEVKQSAVKTKPGRE